MRTEPHCPPGGIKGGRHCLTVLVLALVAFGCGSAGIERPSGEAFDVQGHRGARGLLPENTLEAFELALELGVTTLELDLGVTRDRVVVVSHDRAVNPKVCRGGGEELLRDLDLAEVQSLDCGSLNPDPFRFPEPPRQNVPGAKIPTLAEVFDLAAKKDDGVRFNVEIKIDPLVDDTVPLEEFVDLVVGLVQERGLTDRVTVQSFAWRALELVKDRDRTIETAALLSRGELNAAQGDGTSAWLNGLSFETAGGTCLGLLEAAASYVDVFSPIWRLVMPGSPGYCGSTVEEIRVAGFSVVPWTVNSRRRMAELFNLGVDGLITDYPDVLVDWLREEGVPVR